jgi:hypothetical protein
MSAWTYSEALEAHVYMWEAYTGYVSWEYDSYTAWVEIAGRIVTHMRNFTYVTDAAIWCGGVMWEDYILSERMHNELIGSFSQESE